MGDSRRPGTASLTFITVAWACAAYPKPQDARSDQFQGQPHTQPTMPATASDDGPAANEPLRQEWVDLDKQMLGQLRQLLPPAPLSPDEFVKRFCVADTGDEHWNGLVDDDRDVGFGGRMVRLQRWGGYCTCHVDMLLLRGQFAEFRLCVSADDEYRAHLAHVVSAALKGLAVIDGRDGVTWTFTDSERMSQLRSAIAEGLGPQSEVDVPPELAASYGLLISPFSALHVGEACYFAGTNPEGRKAIEELAEQGRFDLVRKVLRGMNPEGRVYAAQCLMQHARTGLTLAPADVSAIQRVRELAIPIWVCDGCLVSTKYAWEIVPESVRRP